MKLEDVDLRKRFNAVLYVIGSLIVLSLILLSFFFITYLSLHLGDNSKFDPLIKDFFIKNKYATYLNPIYVILIQIILDWGAFICLLSSGVALIFLYVIHKKPFIIPYSLAFIGTAMINIFHFLSSQFEVFTKIPYSWDMLSWWESRVFFVIALSLAPLINRLIEKTKPATNLPTIFFSLLSYSIFSIVFIYFAIAIPSKIAPAYLDFLPFEQHLFFPIVYAIFVLLPVLYFEHKKNESFFTSLLLISLIPFCLGGIYTIFFPQPNYYTSFNAVYFIKFFTFLLPFTGVVLDTRILFCEIEILVDRAKRNIETKNSFITSLSSYLKEPLKRTLSRLQLLLNERDGPLNEQQKLIVETLVSSSIKSSDFVSEIIDLSKIDTGIVFYNPEDFDLSSTIQEATNAYIAKAKQKSINLEYKNPQTPKQITSDPLRVKQILTEIITNALRFTHEGDIILSLEEDEKRYYIKIKDTGIGISADKLASIFTPFYQIDPKDPNKHFGVGLSLALKFAKSMNGNVSLESSPNEGSVFTVTLLKHLLSPEEKSSS